MQAEYKCADFRVEVLVSVGNGGDSEVIVSLVRSSLAGVTAQAARAARVDEQAYASGPAKPGAIPTGG